MIGHYFEKKGAIEVVVRSAMLVKAGCDLKIECLNETNPNIDSICVRLKDHVGNTLTIDITSDYKEALSKIGKRFQTDRALHFCSRLISKKLLVDLDTYRTDVRKYV